jgi:hypothetical protein
MAELEQQRLHQARRALFDDYRLRHASAWIEPRGTSMRPLIGPGTWLQVEFGASEFALGDIILFPLGTMLVAHRIVAWKTRQDQLVLVPKGDAEPYADPLIAPNEILGVVRAVRRKPEGSGTRFGCAGRSAPMIAAISRSLGHTAAELRRLATLLPGPARQLALNAIPPLLRGVARIIFAPLFWATWLDMPKTRTEGGETHELRAPGGPRDLY